MASITARSFLWFHESQDYLVKSIFRDRSKENSDIFSLIIPREQSNKVYDRFRGIMARVATKMITEAPGRNPDFSAPDSGRLHY